MKGFVSTKEKVSLPFFKTLNIKTLNLYNNKKFKKRDPFLVALTKSAQRRRRICRIALSKERDDDDDDDAQQHHHQSRRRIFRKKSRRED